MLKFISENLGTIIVCLLLVCIVAAILVKIVKDKQAGKTSCGSSCAGCAKSASCGKNKAGAK